MNKTLLLLGLLASGFSASAQWLNRPVPFANPAQFNLSISAVDANVAWTTVVEPDNILDGPTLLYARTTNGGQNWTVQPVPGVAQGEAIVELQALDANTAWAIVASDLGTPGATGNRLIKTTNGGQTWTVASTPAMFADSESFPAYLRFFNASQGVVIGEAVGGRFEIYTTSNGGSTWTAVPAANIPVTLQYETIYEIVPRIAQSGTSLWFTTDEGRVFYSANAGQSWAASSTGMDASNEFAAAIAFRDANNGLIMLVDGQLLRTTNGGATWTRLQPGGAYHTVGLDAVPGTRTYVATGVALSGTGPGFGTGAGSSYSTDDGQTWTPIESTRNHGLVDFVSAAAGWSAELVVDANGDVTGGAGMNQYVGTALSSARPQALAVQVAPNPSADGRFRVQVPAGPAAHLRVRDALGRLVLEQPAAAAAETTLDLSRCRAGLYTLELRAGDARGQQKLVVQ
ncbi:T9SS type A sorting domain-containing protein [Hymenobacter jeollabukensis]|uniref:T9SS type A sorting domain-containing protein n=1 Tax=Hymenobacter jeollabukensis TaxID=2025313 RepID=A0A5R8WX74_9BACT|nr:T9SS type A sorting domain-containing protein [Hymenobacter jeollabukensis]TLM96794.1 T9SS type A sorting domain-containing protein [Hymenobacter jeollabukensis]